MKLNGIEIDLINQIAKKHRKPLGYGDWYEFKGKLYLLPSKSNPLMSDACIPAWTISDCLEWLMDKGYSRIDIVFLEGRFVLWLVHENEDKRYEPDGDTILEAFLKAVLAVLEKQ